MTAEEVIKKLKLKPLPEEGGYYRETFRDPGIIPGKSLPNHDGDRSYSTAIYYLITPEEFSGLHLVKSAEIFHFYSGYTEEMVQISENGELNKIILSNGFRNGYYPQVVVPPNVWQGTKLIKNGKWALLGCTVAPGFEFSDFAGGTYSDLAKLYPSHKRTIREFTKE